MRATAPRIAREDARKRADAGQRLARPIRLDFGAASADSRGERIASGNNVMMDSNARPFIDPTAEPGAGSDTARPTEEANEQTRIAQLVETLSKESAEYKDKLL